MRINSLFYTFKQGFKNLFRNSWFTLASIATISACLFLFGIFYSILINFQNMVHTAQESVSVTVFFDCHRLHPRGYAGRGLSRSRDSLILIKEAAP